MRLFSAGENLNQTNMLLSESGLTDVMRSGPWYFKLQSLLLLQQLQKKPGRQFSRGFKWEILILSSKAQIKLTLAIVFNT